MKLQKKIIFINHKISFCIFSILLNENVNEKEVSHLTNLYTVTYAATVIC